MQTQVHLNNKITPIGGPIPDKIEYFQVYHQQHPFIRQPLPHTQVILIQQWFNNVIDALELVDGYMVYNGILIRQEDIKKFKL